MVKKLKVPPTVPRAPGAGSHHVSGRMVVAETAARVTYLHQLLPLCLTQGRVRTWHKWLCDSSSERITAQPAWLLPFQDSGRRERPPGQGHRAATRALLAQVSLYPHPKWGQGGDLWGSEQHWGWGLGPGRRGRGRQGKEVRKEEGRRPTQTIEKVGREGVVLGSQRFHFLFSAPLQPPCLPSPFPPPRG